ncbi:TolC family protein [Terriglobus albidus]|uniref:TolC family protein n=1 Tax=Terriglobus albidus TaxID=1592106 RepID=A0A5B9EEL7_9BACT|nr:TolC family protein [Terriglobus albidus]QEE30482.1 TolC family protein [Terriglobus albidus]
MFKGRLLVLCVLLSASAYAPAQQTSPSTVEELVRIGIERNQDLAAAREGIAEARGLKRQAGVRPAPGLTLKGATGRPIGTIGEDTYGADFSQEVETFGKRGKRIAVAGFDVDKAEAELAARSAELAYEIRVAAADRSAEADRLAMLRQLSDANRQALGLTEARVGEGDAPALEANLLKVELAKATVQINSARGRLSTAEATLRRLAQLAPGEALPDLKPASPATDSLQAFIVRANEGRADLRTARLNEAQSKTSIDLSRANAKPNVSLGAGYIRQTSQFDDLFGFTPTGAIAPLRDRDDILSFSISVPLKSNRSGRGEVEAATARNNAARLHREYLEKSIPTEVEAAFRRLEAAQASLKTLDTDVVPGSEKNLEVIREAYRLGQLRLLDVINEQRQVVDNRVAYIDAQAEVQRAWAELERAIGGNLP